MPANLGNELFSAEGTYVATTTSGDWLDRVAVQQLGLRTRAVLLVFESGVLLNRDGVPDVFIPAESLTEIRTESGMAGKFVEKDGLIVIMWLLGEQALDTGFRTREAAAKHT
ncbi:MAG: hypothetical protein HIU81_11075, partial [Acidobacteria bacterium]|nr:hypothetical protein [Acidobacteriota bacterium]